MIDGIIICQADEVQQVMKLFEVISSANFLGINLYDIKTLLAYKKSTKFIRVPILEASEPERSNNVAKHIFNQIPEGTNIDDMIIGIESDYGLSLEKLTSLTAAIEGKINNENFDLFYGANYIDKTHFFWVGAIYVTRNSSLLP